MLLLDDGLTIGQSLSRVVNLKGNQVIRAYHARMKFIQWLCFHSGDTAVTTPRRQLSPAETARPKFLVLVPSYSPAHLSSPSNMVLSDDADRTIHPVSTAHQQRCEMACMETY